MSLPDVNVEILNGALGSVADSPDGVTALVMSGVATPNIALAAPKVVFSLAEAEALGITETGTNAAAHRHIKEFYLGYQYITGSEVAELYLMLVADTMTLTQMADITEASGAKKLVDYSAGRVRRLGLTRTPGVGYTPVVTDGIDKDSLDALPKAHALGESYKAKQVAIRTLVEGRAFALANIGSAKDLKTYTYNRSGVVLLSSKSDGSSSVGFVLGVSAGLADLGQLQRSIARVRNGPLPIDTLYIGDTLADQVTGVGTLHDKGYITVRKFPTRAGYYFTDDPMACPTTDDYSSFARGLVIDKAQRLLYDVYLDEVNDDIEVDTTNGQLPAGFVAFLEERGRDRLSKSMAGNISGAPKISIDPNQNVLATGKTEVRAKITPKGYNKQIGIKLSFDNPANT